MSPNTKNTVFGDILYILAMIIVEIVRRLRPDIVIERFAGEAPPRYHHLEGWGLVRNETLLMMLDKELERKNVHQGDIFNIFAPKFQ